MVNNLHHGPAIHASPPCAGDKGYPEAMSGIGHPKLPEEPAELCGRLSWRDGVDMAYPGSLEPLEDGQQGTVEWLPLHPAYLHLDEEGHSVQVHRGEGDADLANPPA